MGISVIVGAIMTAAQTVAAESGALDEGQVYWQFLCTTEDGGHDPDGEPDDRVRPEHAALHTTVWRLDDALAPVPPCDWGCRCAMRHCAPPDTLAARVTGVETGAIPATLGHHYEKWLTEHRPGWEVIAKAARAAPVAKRIEVAVAMAKAAGMENPSSTGQMIVSTLPPEKATPPAAVSVTA